MPDLEHARLLLAIARRDLRTAEAMVNSTVFSGEVFGFHAQQASEKALKAWLTVLGCDYPCIHDLDELLSLVRDRMPTIGAEFSSLSDLTPFAVQFRYDMLDTGMSGIDRPAIVTAVHRLVDYVSQLIVPA